MGGDGGVKAPSTAGRPGGDDRGPGPLAVRLLDRWLAPVLFLVTLFSTLVAGSLLRGTDPLGVEFGVRWGIPFWWPTALDPGALLAGAPFALPFVGILLAHEWAHRVAGRAHGMRVSPPFFIPAPPHLSVVGTLGAFVRLRSRVPSRRALLDVALSGPLVSFLLSVPVLVAGLLLSVPSGRAGRSHLPFLVEFGEVPIRLGEPLLVRGIVRLLPAIDPGTALHLHPLAFAGWLGLVLTFLNLLPLDRLDGGHLLHALAPGRQRWWARATVVLFLALGFVWSGWWLWAGVTALLGGGRTLSPDALPPGRSPSPGLRRLAWGVMAGMLLLLPPVPVGF